MIAETQVEKMVTKSNEKKERTCIITSRCYGDTLGYLLFLMKIAQREFPLLRPKDIDVKQYAGRFRKRLFGIEFTIDCEVVPDGYKEISDHMVESQFSTF